MRKLKMYGSVKYVHYFMDTYTVSKIYLTMFEGTVFRGVYV